MTTESATEDPIDTLLRDTSECLYLNLFCITLTIWLASAGENVHAHREEGINLIQAIEDIILVHTSIVCCI